MYAVSRFVYKSTPHFLWQKNNFLISLLNVYGTGNKNNMALSLRITNKFVRFGELYLNFFPKNCVLMKGLNAVLYHYHGNHLNLANSKKKSGNSIEKIILS